MASLSAPLPDKYKEGLAIPAAKELNTSDYVIEANSSEIHNYLAAKLPKADRKEVPGEFKKTLVLAAQKPKGGRSKTVRKSKKQLSARERRSLGLFRLPRRGLAYSSFLALHRLWVAYMEELLDLAGLQAQGWAPAGAEEPSSDVDSEVDKQAGSDHDGRIAAVKSRVGVPVAAKKGGAKSVSPERKKVLEPVSQPVAVQKKKRRVLSAPPAPNGESPEARADKKPNSKRSKQNRAASVE